MPGVHDKDLIPKINVIVADEIKRKPKWGISSHHTSTKVYGVGASKRECNLQQGTIDRKATTGQKDGPKGYQAMAKLQAFRSELATLKALVEKGEQCKRTSPGYSKQQWHRRPMGCSSCQEEGRPLSCVW